MAAARTVAATRAASHRSGLRSGDGAGLGWAGTGRVLDTDMISPSTPGYFYTLPFMS